MFRPFIFASSDFLSSFRIFIHWESEEEANIIFFLLLLFGVYGTQSLVFVDEESIGVNDERRRKVSQAHTTQYISAIEYVRV